MPIPQMNIFRHDRMNHSLITLAGEIDLASAPLLRQTLHECLRHGIRQVDIDLTAVTFCDCSGLNTFLAAAQHTATAGATLRLHHPQPMLRRLLAITGTGFLLSGPPATPVRPPPPHHLVGSAPARRPSPRAGTAAGLGKVTPALSGSAL